MTVTSTIRRNSKHPSLGARTPARNEDFFDPDAIAQLRDYTRPLKRLRAGVKAVSILVDLVLIFGLDLGPTVAGWVDGMPWPIQVVFVLTFFSLITQIIHAPGSWWVSLVYDKRQGLSNQTPGLWVKDQVKEVVLGAVVGGTIFTALFWAVRTFSSWWLIGGAVFLVLAMFMNFVYPVLIMPRFNKFTPMQDGELRTRIEEIAALAETQIEGVYTMDGSKRSSRANAFVAGFGPTKRVVVFDTMVDQYPLEQIGNVVAHEIGHYRLNHIPKSFPLAGFQMLLTLAFVQYVGGADTVLGWAGVDALGDPGSLPLFLAAMGVPSAVLALVSAWVSRHHEREADLEALELLGDPSNFVALWPAIAMHDKADLEPSWWNRLNASHPGIAERMQFGLDWAEMNGVAVTRPPLATVPEPAA